MKTSTGEILSSSEEQLQTLARSSPGERLDELFKDIWQEIRNGRYLPGQPRSAASRQSLALAKIALQLATYSNNEKLLIDAWHMMAHSLMADEQYEQAIPYYEKRIQHLDRNPTRRALPVPARAMSSPCCTPASMSRLWLPAR